MSVRVNEIIADRFEILEMPTAVVVGIRKARGAADEEEEEDEDETVEGEEGAEASTEAAAE